MQRAALARAHAAFVEDLRDLLVGVMRDELIDGGNDLRTGVSTKPDLCRVRDYAELSWRIT